MSRAARGLMDRIAFPLILVAVALLGFVCLLHFTGAWDRVVDATEKFFGTETAERVDALGDRAAEDPGSFLEDALPGSPEPSQQGDTGTGQSDAYVPDSLPDARPGDDTQIDWAHVQKQLDGLPSTDELNAQRIEPYDRDRHFGDWVDHNDDGCSEDNEVRLRDSTDTTIEPGTVCDVQTGTLHDPYSGKDVPFDRADKPLAVEVEHIVALYDVYYSGGWKMTYEQRVQISHDLDSELVLVSRDENQAKKQKTPAEWMPSDPAAWCWYAASYIEVKDKYGLSVDQDNRTFLGDVIAACKG